MLWAKTVGTLNVVGFVAAIILTIAANLYESDNIGYVISQQSLTIGLLIWMVIVVVDYLQTKLSFEKSNESAQTSRRATLNQICTPVIACLVLGLLALTSMTLVVSTVTPNGSWYVIIALAAFAVLVRVSVTLVRDSIKAVRALVRRKEYA